MIGIEFKLFIINDNTKQDVTAICKDGVEVSSERSGSPAKLSFSLAFSAVGDNEIKIEEGNIVEFYYNDYPMFKGYIFTTNPDIKGDMGITAYDQLRYFKNKGTYVYTNKKASDVLKMIIQDFKLKAGYIEDTEYVIASRTEDNRTLFDIVITAIELTLVATKKMYILYDDFGKLILKNIENLRSKLMLTDDETMLEFDYKTDIDSDTYNQVKLYKDNEKTGKRDVFIAKNSETINKWGLLQYYEQAEGSMNDVQIDDYAQKLLKQKNRVKKTLKITCLGTDNGEEKLRGGSIVYIKIDKLGISNWFVCESVNHSFSNCKHEVTISVYDF